ncbi:MAG: hypothetical protein JXX28_00425 [Deltaproteobacteria bacterium]|nr:hypothetical protein [Deltaproteobacteria bacterium]
MTRLALVALASLALGGTALADTAAATIGAGCAPQNGALVVPAGKTATSFQLSALSHGTSCGVTPIDYDGWGLKNGGATVYSYSRRGGSVAESAPLSTLTLPAGTYTVYVDGGQGAQVVVTFALQ